MINFFKDSVDNLDAAIYTGDALDNPDHRKILKRHVERWLRAIKEHEEEA